MKRFMWLGLIAAVALVGAGLAVAAMRDKGTTAVAFSFVGTSGDSVRTRTCTGVDGTYVLTRALYTGTATGLYNGAAARLRLESTVNTTGAQESRAAACTSGATTRCRRRRASSA